MGKFFAFYAVDDVGGRNLLQSLDSGQCANGVGLKLVGATVDFFVLLLVLPARLGPLVHVECQSAAGVV